MDKDDLTKIRRHLSRLKNRQNRGKPETDSSQKLEGAEMEEVSWKDQDP